MTQIFYALLCEALRFLCVTLRSAFCFQRNKRNLHLSFRTESSE